jgi:hypothetical protein
MKNQSFLTWLVLEIGILSLIAAGLGVFWQGEGETSVCQSIFHPVCLVAPSLSFYLLWVLS